MSIFAPLDSSANDERPSSSSYSPSPQTRPKISVLNGIDQMDTWSASVVLAFIQAKILGDIAPLKLRCLPQQIKSIVAIEDAYWKRFLDLKVVSELKLMGFHAPLPPVPRCLPPVEMKFVLPDYDLPRLVPLRRKSTSWTQPRRCMTRRASCMKLKPLPVLHKMMPLTLLLLRTSMHAVESL